MKLGNIILLLVVAAMIAAATLPGLSAGLALGPIPVPAEKDVRGPPVTSAKIVDYGTNKDAFSRGEKATGFITIQNTGNTVINDVTTGVSARISLPIIGSLGVGSKDFTLTGLNIQPGESKRIEFTVDIPSEYKGMSTAGSYDLRGVVRTGGTDIGSFSKTITVK